MGAFRSSGLVVGTGFALRVACISVVMVPCRAKSRVVVEYEFHLPMALERPRELMVWSNSLAHVAMRSIRMSRGVLSALQDHSQCCVVSGV